MNQYTDGLSVKFSTMNLLVTLSFIVLYLIFSNAAKLQPYFKKCAPHDKDCLRSNFQEGVRKMAKGWPAYGLIAIDPLIIPQMTIGAGKNVVNVQQFYKNVSISGFTDLTVDDFELDMKIGTFNINMTYPGFKMNAQYNMMGRILVLPILGNGNCTITLGKAKPTYEGKFDVLSKKGGKYMKIKSHIYHINADFAQYNFENIFKGDKRLGNEINKVINENWKEIYEEIVPGYEAAIGMLLTTIANRFLARVPVSGMFLHQT